MMTTSRSQYEIEIGLGYLREFDFTKNLVVFNVNAGGKLLPLDHECDVLICDRSGFLTEIEIKRSWSDFKADFKKYALHTHCGVIRTFYYCVSSLFAEKVIDEVINRKVDCNGVLIYDEGPGDIRFKLCILDQESNERQKVFPVTMESQLYLAKLGCMRQISFRRKLVDNPQKTIQQYIPTYKRDKK